MRWRYCKFFQKNFVSFSFRVRPVRIRNDLDLRHWHWQSDVLATRFDLIHLQGHSHEIFCFWFFSWNSFPTAPEYPIRTDLNFFWKFFPFEILYDPTGIIRGLGVTDPCRKPGVKNLMALSLKYCYCLPDPESRKNEQQVSKLKNQFNKRFVNLLFHLLYGSKR